MNTAYDKLIRYGNSRRFVCHPKEKEWAQIQVACLSSDCLREVRARLDVELADYAAHKSPVVRNELESVLWALSLIRREGGAVEAGYLEQWLYEQLMAMDALP